MSNNHFPPQRFRYYADYYGPRDNRTKRRDEELATAVQTALGFDSWVNASQIDVDVRDGVVTLNGTVDTLLEKRAAGDDAWDVPGVADVINQLNIRGLSEEEPLGNSGGGRSNVRGPLDLSSDWSASMAPKLPIYDISVPIHPGMPLYPGTPPVTQKQVNSLRSGDVANVFQITMATHVGTHVDAPHHVNDSLPKLADIDLQILVGPCTVVELAVGPSITPDDLRVVPWNRVERLLLKTRNSQLWDGTFHHEFAYLTVEAGKLIASHQNVRLVGIDYLSVDSADSTDLPVHHLLLGNGIIIIEGLNLYGISPGDYELICLPLNIETGDGAPARAILRG